MTRYICEYVISVIYIDTCKESTLPSHVCILEINLKSDAYGDFKLYVYSV